MAPKIERIVEDLRLGEAPHWDEQTQSLYFVDMLGKHVYKYTPSTKSFTKATVGEQNLSFIIPVEDQNGKFVIGNGNELSLVEWDGKSDRVSPLETLVKLKNEGTKSWNDGKADSSGRLWAGVIYPQTEGGFYYKRGSLYTLNKDRSLTTQIKDVTLSNGLAWDESINKFYYIDTLEAGVYQFDYDATSCSVSNQKTIFSIKLHNIRGLPDGMTIDSNGNLWVACFGANRVIQIDPRRPDTLLRSVEIPASQVTSVAFGGENLDELYVTTARIAQVATDLPEPKGPEHGALYRITGLGVKGLHPNKVRL